MQSMTGFGRASGKSAEGRYDLEVSSVNNRFLEFSFRLPRQYTALEAPIREYIQSKISRGKVTVFLSASRSEGADGHYFNRPAAEYYLKALREFQKKQKLSDEPRLSDVLAFPEVTRPEAEEVSIEDTLTAVMPLLEKALSRMVRMRTEEGKRLRKDMLDRVKVLSSELTKVESEAKHTVKDYRERLKTRVEALLKGAEFDQRRLEEEVAILAEKADIAEEITRLHSHLDQMVIDLKKNDPIGRRLNFLLQEINREANTIGSKAMSMDISKRVIVMKEEIERIREQVQNVE